MPGKRGDLATRFWAKVDKRGPSQCWPWTGAVSDRGYGNIYKGKRGAGTAPAHHVALGVQKGVTLKPGETIDHTYVFKLCMNADHYDVCSRVENTLRKNQRRLLAAGASEAPRPRSTEADFDLGEYKEAA